MHLEFKDAPSDLSPLVLILPWLAAATAEAVWQGWFTKPHTEVS